MPPLAPLPEEDVEYVLTGHRWCTPVVAELTLTPQDARIDFTAGQYLLLQDAERVVPVRSYSVAGAPRADGRLTFLVTAVDGGPTSTWLARTARIGDKVLASGPYGTFLADPAHRGPTLYLAGGSGLAPARALIEDAITHGRTGTDDPRERHTLVFSARTEADVIDGAWYAETASQQPGFAYIRTLTRVREGEAAAPLGRVPQVLPGILPDLSEHAVYISGAPGFVDACTRVAQRLGAGGGRVHTEEFYAEPAPWHAEGLDRPAPDLTREQL